MKRLLYRRFPRRAVLIGAAAALSALTAASVAQAQLAQRQLEAPDDVVIVRAGQTVSIDPRTGRLRQPSSEEARTLAQQMLGQYQSTSAPIAIQQTTSGMLWVDLPEEYQDVLVLRLLPDGSTRIECVHGSDAASDQVLRGDLPKADDGATTPAATIAKAPALTAQRATAAPARPKSTRKAAKPASISTVRR